MGKVVVLNVSAYDEVSQRIDEVFSLADFSLVEKDCVLVKPDIVEPSLPGLTLTRQCSGRSQVLGRRAARVQRHPQTPSLRAKARAASA